MRTRPETTILPMERKHFPASRRPHSWLPSLRPAMRRPRHARKRASVSASPTTCGPSARPSSRASSPATSRRPSICCCSSSPAACSPAATMTTRSTSGQPRPRTVRPCESTTMLSATSMSVRSTSRSTGPRKSSTGPACPMPGPSPSCGRFPNETNRILFASCVARTLKGQLAFEPKARPEVEATVARLDIDFASAIRSNRDQVWTADLLWSRLRKDRILAIARETLGETWAQAEAKQKKADIAKAMQDAFAHGGEPAGVTAEGRAAAIAWTPPGFRAFDTGTVDDNAVADDTGTTAPEPQPSKIDMPSVDPLEHSSVDPSGADGEARQDDATEADALPGDDPEPTPVEAHQPMNARVHSVVEGIDAPAVAERRAAAIASAVNADTTRHAFGRAGTGPGRAARQRPRQRCGVTGDPDLPAPRLNHRVHHPPQRPAGFIPARRFSFPYRQPGDSPCLPYRMPLRPRPAIVPPRSAPASATAPSTR